MASDWIDTAARDALLYAKGIRPEEEIAEVAAIIRRHYESAAKCPKCDGTGCGQWSDADCSRCRGKGRIVP
jgi:RecJ-like exonuclease